ncbi:MAG: hypothetical protein K2I13_04115 [Alistipes sp.]|nr:hypothetical protein [Alistipes sp.]
MLTFIIQPGPCAAAGQRTEYRIASEPAQTIDIRITDAQTGELLGAKRVADAEEATVDVAPVVRRNIEFDPQPGNVTGFLTSEDRTRTIRVTAATPEAPENETSAAECLFYPANETARPPALLTSMPLQRLLAPGERDELTLLHEGTARATVTATGPGGTTTRNYASATGLLHLFRLCADDFPEAEEIRVDLGAAGTVVYSMTNVPHDACRLAWRSRAGSLEHYTFPTEVSTTVEASKIRVCGPDGYSTAGLAASRLTRLRSACETRAAAEALAEIVVSPEVWRIVGDGYDPQDVVTDTVQLQRQGALNVLEIEIRPRKTDGPCR